MKYDQAWSEILALVREESGSHVVDTWFRALALVRHDGATGDVWIEAPNRFVRDWVLNRYRVTLERHVARVLNLTGSVRVCIEERKAASDMLPMQSVGLGEQQSGGRSAAGGAAVCIPMNSVPVQRGAGRQRAVRKQGEQGLSDDTPHALAIVPAKRVALEKNAVSSVATSGLIAEYQFDNFIVGSHNSLAYAAAHAVAEKLGRLYNPFFIYGSSGLGKTHLIHAIGNAARALHPRVNILYQSANRFVADFIQAIRFDKMYQFEVRFQSIDLLLIDDIQFLSNKEQTQELFFHVFNVLHQGRKQIVCTSDSLPRDIAGLADRVRSRLESGLVTDISAPTLETKIAIVKKKAEMHGVHMTNDVAEYIASLGGGNIREIEGMLIRVCAHASLTQSTLSLALAQRILHDVRQYERGKQSPCDVDLRAIVRVVAHRCGYSLDALRSQSRRKDLAHARHIALYLMKRLSRRSLREIGAYLHRTDHSTVVHAIDKLERLIHLDHQLQQLVQDLERSVLLEVGSGS